jgi:hypothetical protein
MRPPLQIQAIKKVATTKSNPYQTLIRHWLSENLKKGLHIPRRWFKGNSLKWSVNPKNKSVSSLVLFQVEYGIESYFVFPLPPPTSVVREAHSEDSLKVRKYL